MSWPRPLAEPDRAATPDRTHEVHYEKVIWPVSRDQDGEGLPPTRVLGNAATETAPTERRGSPMWSRRGRGGTVETEWVTLCHLTGRNMPLQIPPIARFTATDLDVINRRCALWGSIWRRCVTSTSGRRSRRPRCREAANRTGPQSQRPGSGLEAHESCGECPFTKSPTADTM